MWRNLLMLSVAIALLGGVAYGNTAGQTDPVRVIVGLDMVYRAETDLAGQVEILAQRAEIAALQAGVLVFLESINATVHTTIRYETLPYLTVEIDPAIVERLRGLPAVDGVFQDVLYSISTADANNVIGAPQAWAGGYDGSGYAVAILDTGVDSTHPALRGKVVHEACFSSGGRSACPSGRQSQVGTGAAMPARCAGCDHGTHVAGIAAGDDGRNFKGAAPGADIIAINVFSLFDSATTCGHGNTPCTMSYVGDQLSAFDHLYTLRGTYHIAAVNLSLGGGYHRGACDSEVYSRPYLNAVDNLRKANIVVIAASGNDGLKDGMGQPACYSNVISVGATDNSRSVMGFSNDARFLDLLAPGAQIYSSIPGGSYARMSGTSMATPFVTGAWAIMRQAYPSMQMDDILARLQNTGTNIRDSGSGLTHARIQIDNAVPAQSVPPTSTPRPTVIPTATPSHMVGDSTLIAYTEFLDALNGLVGLPISITDIVYTFTGIDLYIEFENLSGRVTLDADETGAIDLYNYDKIEGGGLLQSVFAAGVKQFLGEVLSRALSDILEERFGSPQEIARVTASAEGLTVYVR